MISRKAGVMKKKTSHKKSVQWQTDHRRYDFIRIWKKRYYHMVARHEGRATHFSHCEGKGLISLEEFMEWCKDFDNLNVFLALYFDWAHAGFSLHLSPSIDRINPDLGYIVGNLQWLSFSDNTEKNHKYIDPITKKMIREVYEPADAV